MNRKLLLHSLFLTIAGIILNLVPFLILFHWGCPLYLHIIGTVFVSAVGGIGIGVAVAGASTVLAALILQKTILFYYGIIGLIIAFLSVSFALRGYFDNYRTCLACGLAFAAVEGAVGAIIMHAVSGPGRISTASEDLALFLQQSGISAGAGQFLAVLLTCLADKWIVVTAVFLLLKLPVDQLEDVRQIAAKNHTAVRYRRHSLRYRIASILGAYTILLGITAAVIGYHQYRGAMFQRYYSVVDAAVNMAENVVDADSIDGYLASKQEDGRYRQTERQLEEIRDSSAEIEYIYVYQIKEDGCHVVYDIDTNGLQGMKLGEIQPFDEDFSEDYLTDLLAGKAIEPEISHGAYGWLLTVYHPLYRSDGSCVAYIGVDAQMQDIVFDSLSYMIRLLSLMLWAGTITTTYVLLLADKKVILPMNQLMKAEKNFAFAGDEKRSSTSKEINALQIHTGDEIEALYLALRKLTVDYDSYINSLRNISAQLEQKNEDILRLQDNMIVSFSKLAESRDMDTGAHIVRTSAYVKLIAQTMAEKGLHQDVLTPHFIEMLEKSAPLHDIGKICIPDRILNKPGKLTPEEFEIMKMHSVYGGEIVRDALHGVSEQNSLSFAVNIALYHHERWDGAGYPEGLKGEKIPLCARIMALADVYDALISKRCYKEAMPTGKAEEIIRSESGTHFDPQIVDVFLSVKDKFAEIARRYRDDA